MSSTATSFVSCEDDLPPIFGLFNFYATLSSVPLLFVPISSLLTAVRLTEVRKRAPFIHAALIMWLLTLTTLFFTNLFQHIVGGRHYIFLHETMANVQGLWHSSLINAIRRKKGWNSIPERAGLAVAAITTVAVVLITFTLPDTDTYEAVNGIVQGLTGIFIVGSHGALSWRDARAWRLFRRSCIGLLLVVIFTGPHGLESKLCHLRSSIWYHAVVDHACIVCLFGGVAKNSVHLAKVAVTNEHKEKDY